MTRNIALTAIALPLLLAACGTPQERCIRKNTVEYRNVSNLLSEVEANLARGYAWEERISSRTVWSTCRDYVRDRDGVARSISRPCWREVDYTERYRVPIDPAAEARLIHADFNRSSLKRLEWLQTKRAELHDADAIQALFDDDTAPICMRPETHNGSCTFATVVYEMTHAPRIRMRSGIAGSGGWTSVPFNDHGEGSAK